MLPRVRTPILLRRLALSDLADFQSYRADPELGLYQGWSPMSDEQASEFLTEMNTAPLLRPGQWSQIGIASEETGHLLGDVGLLIAEDSCQAEVGFTLSKRHQGHGVATAAVLEAVQLLLEQTPIRRIIAVTDARNIPSIRLLERTGMTLVSTDSATFRGEPCIEHTYALARPQSDA